MLLLYKAGYGYKTSRGIVNYAQCKPGRCETRSDLSSLKMPQTHQDVASSAQAK